MAPRGTIRGSEQRAVRLSCEACRAKKIRCPGEHPTCSKCLSGGRQCSYVLQKPMGRPKARRQAGRREQLLPRRSSAMQILSPSDDSFVGTDSSATTTSDAGTDTSPVIGSESDLTIPAVPSQGPDPEGFEIHQCLLDLGNHPRDCRDVVPNKSSDLPPPAPSTQPTAGGCACLSVLYLLLEHLRVKDDLTAPDDFALLRSTIQSASEVLTCQNCPLRYFSIVQNAAMLGILCLCVAESYHRIVRSIDVEERRASNAGEKKQLSIHNGSRTGEHDSEPLRVEVAPAEWRNVMRNLVRAEVFGVEGQRDKCLKGFLDRLEQRQRRWHQTPPAPDCPPSYRSLCGPSDREPTCLKLIDNSKRLIGLLEF